MFGVASTEAKVTETVAFDQGRPVSLGKSTELLAEEGGASFHCMSVSKRLERTGKLRLRLFRLLRLLSWLPGVEHHNMFRLVVLPFLLLNVLVVGAVGPGLVPSDG